MDNQCLFQKIMGQIPNSALDVVFSYFKDQKGFQKGDIWERIAKAPKIFTMERVGAYCHIRQGKSENPDLWDRFVKFASGSKDELIYRMVTDPKICDSHWEW